MRISRTCSAAARYVGAPAELLQAALGEPAAALRRARSRSRLPDFYCPAPRQRDVSVGEPRAVVLLADGALAAGRASGPRHLRRDARRIGRTSIGARSRALARRCCRRADTKIERFFDEATFDPVDCMPRERTSLHEHRARDSRTAPIAAQKQRALHARATRTCKSHLSAWRALAIERVARTVARPLQQLPTNKGPTAGLPGNAADFRCVPRTHDGAGGFFLLARS